MFKRPTSMQCGRIFGCVIRKPECGSDPAAHVGPHPEAVTDEFSEMSTIPIIQRQEERDVTLIQSTVRHDPVGAGATLETLLNRLHSWPRPAVITVTLLFATLIAIVDYSFGDKVPLIVLYLPVVAVT